MQGPEILISLMAEDIFQYAPPLEQTSREITDEMEARISAALSAFETCCCRTLDLSLFTRVAGYARTCALLDFSLDY